jgi:hypothetical protein
MRPISHRVLQRPPTGPTLLGSNPRMSSFLARFYTSDDGLHSLWQQNGLWQQQLLPPAAASSFLLMLCWRPKSTRYCARMKSGCRLSHPHRLPLLHCHPTLDRLPCAVTAHQSAARHSVHPSKIAPFPQEEKEMNICAGRSCVGDGWAAGRADWRIGRWHLLLPTQYFRDQPAWEHPPLNSPLIPLSCPNE